VSDHEIVESASEAPEGIHRSERSVVLLSFYGILTLTQNRSNLILQNGSSS
jgi:hypothetical protein